MCEVFGGPIIGLVGGWTDTFGDYGGSWQIRSFCGTITPSSWLLIQFVGCFARVTDCFGGLGVLLAVVGS